MIDKCPLCGNDLVWKPSCVEYDRLHCAVKAAGTSLTGHFVIIQDDRSFYPIFNITVFKDNHAFFLQRFVDESLFTCSVSNLINGELTYCEPVEKGIELLSIDDAIRFTENYSQSLLFI
jgi:hypothetical protein